MLNKVEMPLPENEELFESEPVKAQSATPSLANGAPHWSPQKRSSTVELTAIPSECRSLSDLFQQFATTADLLKNYDSTELGSFKELPTNSRSAHTAISSHTQTFCDRYRHSHPIIKDSDGSTIYTVPQFGITTRSLPGHNNSLIKHFGCLIKIRVSRGATHFDQCTFERGPRQFITASQFKQALTEEIHGSHSLPEPAPHLTLYAHGFSLSAGTTDLDSAKLALAGGTPVVNIDFKSYPFQDKVMALALDQTIAFVGAERVNLVGSREGFKFNADYLTYRYRTNTAPLRMHIITDIHLEINELKTHLERQYNEIIEGSDKTLLVSQREGNADQHQLAVKEIASLSLLNFSKIASLLHNERINSSENEQVQTFFPGENLDKLFMHSLIA